MNTNDHKINLHYVVAWSTVGSKYVPASLLLCGITAPLELVQSHQCTKWTSIVFCQFSISLFSASICPSLHLSLYVSLAPGQSSCLLQRRCGSVLLWRCLKLCQLFYFLMSTTLRTLHDENIILADTVSTLEKIPWVWSFWICFVCVCVTSKERDIN